MRLSRLSCGVSRDGPAWVCLANSAIAVSTALRVSLSSFAYSARNSFPIARRATGYILPGQLTQAGCPKGMLDDPAHERRRTGTLRAARHALAWPAALHGSGPVEGFGVGEHAAQPGLIFAQDADLEVRLPFRPGRGALGGGGGCESR